MTLLRKILAILVLFTINTAYAFDVIDESTIFAAVVQGHHGNNNSKCNQINNPQLTMYTSAKITGTSGSDLAFCSINTGNGLPANSCDTASGGSRYCTVSGTDLRGLSMSGTNAFVNSTGASGGIGYCDSNTALSLGGNGGNQFGYISLYNNCSLTFSSSQSTYYITSLAIGSGAKVYLPAGDYWIGSLDVNADGYIIPTGTVRIFVGNYSNFNSGYLNASSTGRLTLIGYNTVHLTGTAQINGYVYSAASVVLNGTSVINGRVAANYLQLTDASRINLATQTSTASIDHFELVLPGSAVTCLPASLTLRACQNASCSSLYTGSTSVTLSPSSLTNGAWVTGNPVTLTSGTATLSLRQSSAATVTVGVSSSTPAATNATLCQVGTGTLSAANCALTFADSGFVLTVPNKTANKPVSGTIQANASCVAAFANVSRTINFWSGYSNPTAASIVGSAPPVTVNGTAIGKSSATATGISLTFDATGTAPLSSVNYADAGAMTLNASYSGSSTTSDAGQNMTGNTTFVSAPAGICIAPATTCSAGDVTCPAYKRAGETFSVTLKPVAWESDNDTDLCSGNAVTPNFTLAGIALGSTVVAPSGGAAATLAVTSYDHVASAGATQSVTESLSEVGVFRLTATPPTYLGMTIPASQSAPVGRITPWDFYLSAGTVTPACSAGFSYMGQPFGISYTLIARNGSGATTTNYSGSFAKSSAVLMAENANDGVDRSARIPWSNTNWNSGVQTVSASPVTFSRLAGTTPDGPFSQLSIGVGINDTDTLVASVSNADMNPGSTGSCTTCTAKQIGATQQMLAGRLNAGSASAIPTSALTVPLAFEYWNGSAWTLNSADLCSALTLSSSGAFLFDRPWSASSQALTLAGTATSTLGLSSTRTGSGSSSATAQGGYLWLHFSAPGVNDRAHYRIGLAAQSPAATWLSYDWNGDGSAVQDESGGWVFFNQWRGSDRVIYRREAW